MNEHIIGMQCMVVHQKTLIHVIC